MSRRTTRTRRLVRRATRRTGDDMPAVLRKLRKSQKPSGAEYNTGAAPVLQGATSLTIMARQGSLPAGLEITISGQAYTIQAAAEVDRTVGGFLSVPISPALVGNLAPTTTVTIAAYAEWTYPSFQFNRQFLELSDRVGGSVERLHLEWIDGQPMPEEGDVLRHRGRVQSIAQVEPMEPGDGAAGWLVTLGDAA